jgi:hypothetical protein
MKRGAGVVDPFSLGALGAVAATEGIKFLYGQAAEVLKRWRARKNGEPEADAPIAVEGADLLQGTLEPPRPKFDIVERVEQDLKELVGLLGNYANGVEDPDPNDPDLVETVEALRKALELIYGQRITFKGEQRDASGPVVFGKATVDEALGDITGVRARVVRSGRVVGEADVKVARGNVDGVNIDTVG